MELKNGMVIEINDAGGGDIDMVFTSNGVYASHTVNWAEAKVIAQLLVKMADREKHHALGVMACDAINSCRGNEKDAVSYDKTI